MTIEEKMKRFDRPHTIYSIDNPETGDPLYIGQTVNLPRRIKEHLNLRPGKASTEFLEPMIAAGIEPIFTGKEQDTAWLNNAAKAQARFGAPEVSVEQMLDWISDWLMANGETLGKPTHFQTRDGNY